MHLLDKNGEELDVCNGTVHRHTSPIIVKSDNTDEQVLFDGTAAEFEDGVLAVLIPEDPDYEINHEVFISDEVRGFVNKFKEEGY